LFVILLVELSVFCSYDADSKHWFKTKTKLTVFYHRDREALTASTGLHMYGNVGVLTITLSEQGLHLRGFVMSLTKGDIASHADVQLDGVMVADTPGPQIVRLYYIRK
jgi:hypothetical protein